MFFMKEQPLNRIDLYAEWALWSRCLGKVVVINGTSSSGKSTLAKYTIKLGFNIINVDKICDQILFDYFNATILSLMSKIQDFLTSDDLRKIYFKHKINKDKYNVVEQKCIIDLEHQIKENNMEEILEKSLSDKNIYNRVYDEAKKFIFSGQNVVIDTVLTSNQEIDLLFWSFHYYKVSMLLLYSPLEMNLEKCFLRNQISLKQDLCDYRSPSQVIEQYLLFYTFECNPQDKQKILEKVNKLQVIGTLTDVEQESRELFHQIHNSIDYDRTTKSIDTTRDFVEKAYTSMKLDQSEQNIFVTTEIKYDYILKDNTATEDIELILGDIQGYYNIEEC